MYLVQIYGQAWHIRSGINIGYPHVKLGICGVKWTYTPIYPLYPQIFVKKDITDLWKPKERTFCEVIIKM